MDKNLIGTNAGIVWRTMIGRYSWTFQELKEQIELSDAELWTAIGWLARENQIEFDNSGEEERIYLNQSYF
ncbi:MAG: winged helix-turn-helix domain-containing protein [Bacteroidaceae bacterium]|nr:winged helix-turn-helix domain-containing protein [Bacteroidaceae bacterium]